MKAYPKDADPYDLGSRSQCAAVEGYNSCIIEHTNKIHNLLIMNEDFIEDYTKDQIRLHNIAVKQLQRLAKKP